MKLSIDEGNKGRSPSSKGKYLAQSSVHGGYSRNSRRKGGRKEGRKDKGRMGGRDRKHANSEIN